MSNALSEISVEQLKRAVEIKEQIDALQNELTDLLEGDGGRPRVGRPRGPGRPKLGRPPGRRRRMSAAARAAIGAAQRARWAAKRGEAAPAASAPRKRKRRMTKEWRAKLSAAAKARWAKSKREGRNTL